MWIRLTKLGSWGRHIGCVAINCRSLSHPQLPHPSVGWTYPPLVAQAQLLVDMHDSLGHYRQAKLLSILCRSYWWPGIYTDIADCIQNFLVCQWDKLPELPKEELHWMDKGGAPFIR